jgi:hypothetical protein
MRLRRRNRLRNLTKFSFLLISVCLAAACGGTSGGSSSANFPGTKEGARALLAEFQKPGADTKKLTMELRPTKEDYLAFYSETSTAERAEKFFEPLWSGGNAEIAAKEGQTELKLFSATPEEMRKDAGDSAEMPASLLALADDIKPNVTVYTFKFVKPGETSGMAYEGLVHVNGKWRLFPKPWRFMSGS